MKYIISAIILLAQILIFATQPVAIFLPNTDFDWIQYEYLADKLDSADISHFVISVTDDTCRSVGGRYVLPYATVENISIDIDYLIIPGCTGMIRVYDNEHLLQLIEDIHNRGGIIASSGYGAMPIVHSGIAKGAKISMQFNQSFYEKHRDMDIKFVYYDAIIDSGILTSHSRDHIAVFTAEFIRIYNETAHTESE